MRIVIAGGTGFLGRPLARQLAAEGHDVVALTRGSGSQGRDSIGSGGRVRAVAWVPDGSTGPWAAEVDGAGAVVNLAGASIAGSRWSNAHKQLILDSRIQATRSLVTAIEQAEIRPPVFVSGSAVGYYGPRGDEVVTEQTEAGTDFLADVCVKWEAEAQRAASDRTRVVRLRTGLVLDKDGGALPPMLPPFRFGVGGPIGSGRQYWPWIHRDDWVALARVAIQSPNLAGPMNATAPEPVTNASFARAVGAAMHRPALLPMPAFAIRLILGEMADGLILSGQRAVPERAERAGFTFKYRRLDDALRAIFNARE
ncbi:MAG TPA: TIGR01777 family oxidoreductase [Vicinamibacterales bacterium]